jgi:hypothetical protein
MLFFQPLACAIDLQPGAVDKNVNGLLYWSAAALPTVGQSQFPCSSAQRRMIGDGEIQSHQLQHRCQQTLRLAKSQAEHHA